MTLAKVSFLLPGYTIERALFEGSVGAGDAGSFISRSAFSFSEDNHQEPWQSQMASLLGFDTAGGKRLPTARLAVEEDIKSTKRDPHPSDSLVRADPVFLKADKDSARLIPSQQLQLSEIEADALLQAINDFLRSDGVEFFRRDAAEWYIHGMNADALESYPPSFLANRNTSSFLPEGDAAADWRRLLSELQMLLHTHPINQQREASGLMPVNSVWFWGGASLPALPDDNPSLEIFSDQLQAQQMSRYCKLSCHRLSAFSDSLMSLPRAEHTVVIDTRLVDAWLDADTSQLKKILLEINGNWLEPCVDKVRSKTLAQLRIVTEDGLQGICNLQTLNGSDESQAGQWFSKLSRLFRR